MPKETDRERLRLLIRILRDSASNVVVFKERAFVGSAEPDDLGLDRILPQQLSRLEKRARLRGALADWLTSGGVPNRIVYDYDDGADPETVYEFRFEFEKTRLYVKTKMEQEHTDDPVLVIISVKRKN